MNYNGKQQVWITRYERETSFDVIVPQEGMTFEQIARWNIEWWEEYSNDVMRAISNYPNPEFV